MGSIGWPEMLVIIGVCLFVFGSKKLPEIGSSVGRAIKNFKKATTEPDEIDITPQQKKKAPDDDDVA